MTLKSKRFRIAVEGATTDGRNISREWLTQMAKNYNPSVYGARVNLEHIKGYHPDSSFRRFGDVTGLTAEEITEGPLAGKMALYGDIAPTADLVEMVKQAQKVYTSIEVNPKFADTGEAYLIGLAVTDDPASLGTEYLAFSASASANPLANRKQHKDNLFTAAEEAAIEFVEQEDQKPGLLSRITAMFAKRNASDDARFSDVNQAVELVAGEVQSIGDSVAKLNSTAGKVPALEAQITALSKQLNDLQANLSKQDSNPRVRPVTPGGGGESNGEKTDC
ncbi:GPO family capsid scaffolding protein [Serratia entomophila]|uniref:GPO family capsid scaffolding protein n=1 Tax=Serratia entomophila TaxID=42906 RepID=UPI0021787104|nr:GPO family capsid scaffolding protein [Serratia entomophila]CAI0732528.1 Phage capsid scaffolding protein (GPO) serine peptidase [Serratia entomophila]CAI1695187.1 Phage capsid scaffolding protein (GPO) serine peptidase [Serratia entomophila]CAI2446649.1 Phage capsid scaffolding protein (GPO) serine peptidase [Serratia entomophila]